MIELKDRLAAFRARHDHEWSLLSGRLGTLLTSQSFLIIACGSLYSNLKNDTDKAPVLLPLSAVALILCFLSTIVIAINCRVIRDWHVFRAKLFDEDKAGELGAIDILRRTPDLKHLVTAEVFSVIIPILFAGLWIRAILHLAPMKGLFSAPHCPWLATGLLLLSCIVPALWILLCGSAYTLDRKYKAAKKRTP